MLSSKVRNALYIAMYIANAVLVACVQQDVVPAHYLSVALAATMVATSLMKEFGAPPSDAEKK